MAGSGPAQNDAELSGLLVLIAEDEEFAPGGVQGLHGFAQLALGLKPALHRVDVAGQFDLQRFDAAKSGAIGAFLGRIHKNAAAGFAKAESGGRDGDNLSPV